MLLGGKDTCQLPAGAGMHKVTQLHWHCAMQRHTIVQRRSRTVQHYQELTYDPEHLRDEQQPHPQLSPTRNLEQDKLEVHWSSRKWLVSLEGRSWQAKHGAGSYRMLSAELPTDNVVEWH